jgi:secreted trypsin-like serine protease
MRCDRRVYLAPDPAASPPCRLTPPKPFCGGTLVAANWVLTAAHCLYGTAAAERKVSVGLHRFNYSASDAAEAGATLRVAAYHAHPAYDATSLANDLALLRFAGPVPAGVAARPVTLDDGGGGGNHTAPGPAFVIGWGSLDVACKDYGSPLLREVAAPLLAPKRCASAEGSKSFDGSKQLCAGDRESGKWHEVGCGDSGGPLLVRGADGTPVQVGIVSWGYGDAPDVYTKVAAYRSWISACIAGQCDKP